MKTRSKAICETIAIRSPLFQKIHPKVEPVIKFPIIVTPTIKGVSAIQ